MLRAWVAVGLLLGCHEGRVPAREQITAAEPSAAKVAPKPAPSPSAVSTSWASYPIDSWKPAIDAYVPRVRPGNQISLGASAPVWATYLSQVHRALHAQFAEGFLRAIADRPPNDPLSNKQLVARVEIGVDEHGRIVVLGIIKSSGLLAFDAAVLESFQRAASFGKAPPEVISADGVAYFHWDMHRGEQECSTMGASPYLLK